MWLNGLEQFKEHLAGKKHRKNVKSITKGNGTDGSGCGVGCSSSGGDNKKKDKVVTHTATALLIEQQAIIEDTKYHQGVSIPPPFLGDRGQTMDERIGIATAMYKSRPSSM